MVFNQVKKTIRQDIEGIVKFQITLHCFLHDIPLSKTELDCLTLLGCRGKMRLSEFCKLASELKILGTSTAVNNCLARIERSSLFLKEGVGKKQIFLNPALAIQTEGNILLEYKIVYLEPISTLDKDSKANSAATVLA